MKNLFKQIRGKFNCNLQQKNRHWLPLQKPFYLTLIILLSLQTAFAQNRYWVHKPFYGNFFSSAAQLAKWNFIEDNGTGSFSLSGTGTGILRMANAALREGVNYDQLLLSSTPNTNVSGTTLRLTDNTSDAIGTVYSLVSAPAGPIAGPFANIYLAPSLGNPIYNSKSITGHKVPLSAPEITVQPQTQLICPANGPGVTFSVTATGNNLSYQWEKVGSNIPGATSSAYTINNAAVSDTGSYMVTISNADGSVTSDVAYLNYIIPTSGGNQTVCFNGDVEQTITATATGGTITWYNAATVGNPVALPTQTGVGTTTYYAEAAVAGCSATARTAVTLTINNAPPAPISSGDQTVCSNGDTYQTLIADVTSDYDLIWYDAAAGGNAVSPTQIGVGSVTYYAEAYISSCPSPSRTAVTLKINPALPTPGIITGPTDVCPLIGSATPTTYSIAAVPGATFYTWHVPAGTTLVSGQGTTAINVVFDNSFALTHSMFTVTAESPVACTSEASELEVLKIIPAIPTSIYGPVNVCDVIGQALPAVYSIDAVDHASSYSWTVPPAALIVSGQGTTTIAVSFSDTFTFGSIKVTANSNCGNRAPRSLTVWKPLPAIPSAITGTTNACPYIGTATPVIYSIQPVDDATSYAWTIPANVSLLNGQGTTSITVLFNSGYITSTFKVRSVTSCGTSNNRALVVVAATGATPGIISGPTNACAFIGTSDTAVYTIRKVSNTNYYVWSVPAGAIIISHPGGTGINDTIIKVKFDNNFISGTKITVQAANCLPGVARAFTVSRVLPSRPGLISGPINVCEFMVSAVNPSGTPVNYSIRKIAGALSYLWTAPTGATISSHPAGIGTNDTIVQIVFNSTFIRGSVTVAAVNGCGAGTARALALSRLVPGTPGIIDVIQTGACPNRIYTYTLASMPYNTTTMLWTVPSGGTIISGQGTTSITVSYISGSIQGNVTAKPYNNCSSGTARTIKIKLAACETEANRATGNSESIPDVSFAEDQFETKIFPNPAASSCKMQILTAGREMINVNVLGMSGNLIKTFSIKPFEIISFGEDLKQGVYFVETIQGKNKRIQKFVKL